MIENLDIDSAVSGKLQIVLNLAKKKTLEQLLRIATAVDACFKEKLLEYDEEFIHLTESIRKAENQNKSGKRSKRQLEMLISGIQKVFYNVIIGLVNSNLSEK